MEHINNIMDKIDKIVSEWEEANTAAMNIPSKFRRYALAGLERGAYIKIGRISEQLMEYLSINEDANFEEIGRAVYEAVKRSNIMTVMSHLNINQ